MNQSVITKRIEENKDAYAGLDWFRLAASLLVIVIHTSPLESYGEWGDFLLTRGIARIAVPFFFMTSGFFLLSRYARDDQKLRAWTARNLRLYALAILLYLPVNLYLCIRRGSVSLPRICKALALEGTFYHLWFFPALLVGAGLSWFLVRRLRFRKAFFLSLLLYLIGLGGDSYYGWCAKLPVLKAFYGQIFLVTDHTRCGLFFAPVFLILGGMAAERARREKLWPNMAGFGICALLLIGEALGLRLLGWQRHDSMYLSLIPCLYFLFRALLAVRERRPKRVRAIALAAYLIHPLMILLLRGWVKCFPGCRILLENSLLHFAAVACLTFLGAGLSVRIQEKFRPDPKAHVKETERAFLEIHLENLRHNARAIRKNLPEECELMAVLKAESYGHGSYETAVCLEKMGVKAFAVATIDEGIALRRYGIGGEILILGYTCAQRARELKKYRLMQTVADTAHAQELAGQKVRLQVHLKIDTGMHRLGFGSEETERIAELFSQKSFQVCGMYTHLCCAQGRSPEEIAFTKEQIRRFTALTAELKRRGIALPKIHMQSSYGFLNMPELACDYVRAGIALYGVPTSYGDRTVLDLDLRPVLSLKSRIVLIRSVKKGECIGYDRGYTVSRDSRIAVLPIGYGDGFPRCLTGGENAVLICGQYAPIIGKICMDQMTVDVTDIAQARVGESALLIGQDPKGILRADAVADRAGSISNELLSRMGRRLPILTVEEETCGAGKRS